MKECSCKNCDLKVYANNECVLHCTKDDWSNQVRATFTDAKHIYFWQEIKHLVEEQISRYDDMLMFNDVIFPEFTRSMIAPLKNEFFYWYKHINKNNPYKLTNVNDKIVHKQYSYRLIQFSNCTFYNFDFYLLDCQTLNLTEITVKNKLKISGMNIDRLLLLKSNNINTLEIDSNLLDRVTKEPKQLELYIDKAEIDKFILKNNNLKPINLTDSTFNFIELRKLSIEEGLFQNLNFKNINEYKNIKIDSHKFQYNVVNTEKAISREYFRFFKHYFFEKKDYIEANKMYQKEMDTYINELWQNIKSGKFILQNLQNIVIAGFGKISSNFGQSWMRPLLLIIIFLFLKVYFSNDYTLSYLFSGTANLWDKISKQFYILIDLKAFGLWDLLSKTLLGLLVYQLTVTIKRKIKY